MVRRTHNSGAANCLQLRYQHSYGLKGLFANATLRCELMRSDNTLVHFIEQELTERLQVIEGLIDDGKGTGEHGGLRWCFAVSLYSHRARVNCPNPPTWRMNDLEITARARAASRVE